MLMIFSLILTVNVAFAENETTIPDVYVSVEGSDSLGNGSVDNPYHTLDYTIGVASNNSNIYLKSGVYNSTGYEIVNKSISITGIGDVTVDGGNGKISQNIFKVHNGSTLVLNNIKFVNGYADIDSLTLSCFNNEGNLYINNCIFNNFSTSTGVIRNLNYLQINNVSTSNLKNSQLFSAKFKSNMKIEFLTNVANCDIYNITTSVIYNNRNINIYNSNLEEYISNKEYDYQSIRGYIDTSVIQLLTLSYCDLLIVNNSYIECNFENYYIAKTHLINNSNIILDNSTIVHNENYNYYLHLVYSNLTAISSVFSNSIMFESSNGNISYSTIHQYLSMSGYCELNVNYNWWGDNKGPRIYKNSYSKVNDNYWIVMSFYAENYNYIVDLSKYTNGNTIWEVTNPSLLNSRYVKFETEVGKFTKSSGYLINSTFKTSLNLKNVNTMIYAKVDNQVLRLAVGNGLTNYTWYISNDEGNDFFCDGSFDNPFKTLSCAVSKAFSGNVIYVKEGVYTLSWNADLIIKKNLTFMGLGNAVLSRPNNRNIFIINEKGILNIENINFTVYTSDKYSNPLIYMNGGILNIKNSNFYNIFADGVICADSSESINLDNVSFKSVVGSMVKGNSSIVNVLNSKFKEGSSTGYFKSCISVMSDVCLVNSSFEECSEGFVMLNPRGYHHTYTINAYICNTTFKNNNLEKINDKMGIFAADEKYNTNLKSTIENCLFYNNVGHLVLTSQIINSTFVNNTCNEYQIYELPNSLIKADLINNSYFENNVFSTKSHEQILIEANEVYCSSFIKNTAAFGILSNPSEVHYSVFVNNTGIYGADDIFVYNGKLNCSSNWWGSNQKPTINRVNVFIGDLILDDWVIMTMEYNNSIITSKLNALLDIDENIKKFNYTLPSRHVKFSTESGELTSYYSYLINNQASTKLIKNTTKDFDVFAKLDNQIVSLTIYNNSTQIIMKNITLFGKDNRYDITLINVNGHKISNQDLNVIIRQDNAIIDSFTVKTNDLGNANFNVEYAVGNYDVSVYYLGNGYFEKCNAKSTITISYISTRLVSYNYTYYGKNNKFYAILMDINNKYVLNQNLTLKIYDSKNKLFSSTSNVMTGAAGRADVLLSLDTGKYKLKWEYAGNEWYNSSYCESYILVKPINTIILLLNSTLYGKGNDYKLGFKDLNDNVIVGETITLTISNDTDSKQYKLITDDNGIASININLIPGTYKLQANYAGDDVYGPYNATAILKVEPVFVTFDFNSHSIIPINGVFTAIAKDMYGGNVGGQDFTLELYNKDVEKIYHASSDASGEINFKIDADEGIYFAIISYNGNTWYSSATSAATITVSHSTFPNKIYLNGSDFIQYYGENKYYLINFKDTSAYTLEGKIISVEISSKDWSKSYDVESDAFGNARLQITLDSGIYNITYKYQNDYYGLFAQKTNSIIIYSMPTSLLASNLIMNYNEPRNFEVKLVDKNGNPISNQLVNINVDNVSYNATTNQNGIAKLLVNLNLGHHNVFYSFDRENYEYSNGSSIIYVVNESKTISYLDSSDVSSLENETLNFTVYLSDSLNNPISSSQIMLNITDDGGNIIYSHNEYTNALGIANFKFKLNYGTYSADICYNGNDKYLPSFNSNKLYIKPHENVTECILYGNDCEMINGRGDTCYFVLLTTIDDDFIKNQKIEFNINGNSYYNFTDDFGRAYLNIPLAPGNYIITARFNGSDNLTKVSTSNHISVYGKLINLYSRDVVKSYNNGTHYYVMLEDANHNPLTNKLIKFNINGKNYENITDEYGFACFEVWLNPGKYEINATYSGQYEGEFASVENNITVLTTLISENIAKYYNGNTLLKATFFNFINSPLKNTDVIFTINSDNYKVKTDSNGIGNLNINLKPAKYNITIINTQTGQKEAHILNIFPTLSSNNLIKYYKSSSKFSATFKDKNGSLLKNNNVKFKINNKFYNVKTNSKGVAYLNADFKPGKYTVTIINTKTGETANKMITIKTTIITKDKKVKTSKKIDFHAKILRSNGKVAKKVTVKFKINKKTYKIKTNSKGIVKLNIKLKKGKYVVATSYNGLTVKNKIVVVK